MNSFLRILFFIILSISFNIQAHAGIYIQPPLWQSPWISVEVTDTDDEHDTDQSFSEQHQYIIQVTNSARRFLGVYIDRLYPPNPVIEIQNGVNDVMINPAEPAVSLDNLGTYIFHWMGLDEDFTNKSRAYILPVPNDLDPGEKVTYRTKLLGLSAINQLPYDLIGSNAPPQAFRLIASSTYSLFNVLLGPLLRAATGLAATENDELVKGLINDIIAHPENLSKWMNMFIQKDFQGLTADYMKFVTASETSVNLLKTHAGGEQVVDKLLSGLGTILKGWNTVGDAVDIPYILVGLGASAWEDEYTIRVVAPQITEIIPNEGVAGDIVAIHGKGFDPKVLSNNKVRFSRLNDFKMLIPASLPGTVVSTEEFPASEECLYVQIPTGFAAGPVEVQVDMLTSNRVSFADNFYTTVKISEPLNDAHLDGDAYTVAATLDKLPEDFPEQPANVRFYIDNGPPAEKVVTEATFTFPLDISQLTFDDHTLKVEAEFPGHTISDTITIKRVRNLSAFQFGRMYIRHVQYFQKVRASGETYGDVYSRDEEYTIRCYDDYCQGSFQGTVFNKDWEIINGSTTTGHIGAVLTRDRQTMTFFEFSALQLSPNPYGSPIPSTFQTRVRGENLPLTDWDDDGWYIQYKVTGKDVCTHLTEDPIRLKHYSYLDSGEKMVDWECNDDSYLEIEFWIID